MNSLNMSNNKFDDASPKASAAHSIHSRGGNKVAPVYQSQKSNSIKQADQSDLN